MLLEKESFDNKFAYIMDPQEAQNFRNEEFGYKIREIYGKYDITE